MDMMILVLGLVLFLGIHSVQIVAPDFRENRIAAMGAGAWRGLYSLVSGVGLLLLIFGYARWHGTAPVLFVAPFWMNYVAVLLMALSFIAMAVFAVPAGRLKPILKHPMLISVKIWAFAHLLVNGDLASLILFLAFLAWAVADRVSVKRRGISPQQTGPASNDLVAILAGLVVWALTVWKLHEWLIGVPVPIA